MFAPSVVRYAVPAAAASPVPRGHGDAPERHDPRGGPVVRGVGVRMLRASACAPATAGAQGPLGHAVTRPGRTLARPASTPRPPAATVSIAPMRIAAVQVTPPSAVIAVVAVGSGGEP
jgi:hypothetical protein